MEKDTHRSRLGLRPRSNSKHNLRLMKKRIALNEAVKFHGHLGPYLVLGLLMGELALKKLRCKKHFGIRAVVKGAVDKPKSCLIDGIQISTGCTYGKGNIAKLKGGRIQVLFCNLNNKKKLEIGLKDNLISKLNNLKTHLDSEVFAKELLTINTRDLFDLYF